MGIINVAAVVVVDIVVFVVVVVVVVVVCSLVCFYHCFGFVCILWIFFPVGFVMFLLNLY